MTRLALLLLLTALAATAEAGTLRDGVWTPTTCGDEPAAPPGGLNLSGEAAYRDSIRRVNEYQSRINTYLDCVVHEANQDHGTVTDAVHERQARVNQFFAKVTEQSKHARGALSGGGSGIQFGSGGQPRGGNGDRP